LCSARHPAYPPHMWAVFSPHQAVVGAIVTPFDDNALVVRA
jgi:hypothetical protein